eukprot:scaffold128551_cov45-Attheya_sp.AAC.1
MEGQPGCYLVYESDSSGKLMLYYSKDGTLGPDVAPPIGFWCVGGTKKIQGFKFSQNGGRQELIRGIMGGDANRRKYFSGWAQFVKAAKAMQGSVRCFPLEEGQAGVAIDVWGFAEASPKPIKLNEGDAMDVSQLDAVAILPKGNDIYIGINTMNMNNFITRANTSGVGIAL